MGLDYCLVASSRGRTAKAKALHFWNPQFQFGWTSGEGINSGEIE